tara:strand:- start:2864 stop:3070 length:207 start_codon:yes stop_codon:yes gene_type:complete
MIAAIIAASFLSVGIAKGTREIIDKTQQLEELKKQVKFREGQIDLLLTAKAMQQSSKQKNGCDCKIKK